MFVSASLPSMTEVWPMIADIGPISMIDQMATQMGVSLAETLAPSIGSELGVYADVKALAPEFVIALEMTNSDAVLGLLAQFAEVPELGLKAFDFKEHKFFLFVNAPAMFQVNITIHENFLLIGTAAAVKIAISRDETNCLLLNDSWKKAWDEAQADSPAFFLFIDLNQLVSQVYDTGLGMASAFFGANLESAPPKDLLLKNLTTFSIWMNIQQDKIAVKGRGFISPSLITFFVPIMFFTTSQPAFDDVPDDWEDEEPIED